jgi:RNA polymerase sigma-70 factor (ECF subfamily)
MSSLSKDDFSTLLEPHLDALWRFASRTCRDRAEAEDALQDALLLAYRKFDGFAPGTNFRAWLFSFVVKCGMSAHRRRRRNADRLQPVEDIDLVAALEQEEAYEGVLSDPERFLGQLTDPIRRAVKGMPAVERSVLLLRVAEGFSYREIAELLDLPMGTVMSHLHRARGRLRVLLADHARATGFMRTTR